MDFDKEGMTDLMDGFRQSGHMGGTLQTLIFDTCNAGPFGISTKAASFALIAGLGDDIFPNLQELLMPTGQLLGGQVAELVEVVRRGAPCARTLRAVVFSVHSLEPVDIEPLQAVLPHAAVTLG